MTTQHVLPEGSVLVRKARTKVTKDSEETATHTLELDFSGVTIEDAMELAAKSAVISWQRQYREHPDRFPEGKVAVKVAELVAGERVKLTPKERAEAALARLTPEEREALLAKFLE